MSLPARRKTLLKAFGLLTSLLFIHLEAQAQFPAGAFWKRRANFIKFSTSAQTIMAGNCSGITTIGHYNANGALTNATSNLTVNLSSSGSTTFYSDATCTTSISSITIASGTSSAGFYFIESTVASIILTAAATSYASAAQSETVNTNAYVWTGGGANSLWATGANWSGGAAPGGSNIAIFNSSCASNCSPTLGANISIGGIRMETGYSGTITQSASYTITIGASGWVQQAGTFTGSSSGGAITLNGHLALSGGTFTATSGTLTANLNWVVSGSPTFNHNSGTLLLRGTASTNTITPGTVTYYNVSFYSYWGFIFNLGGGTMTINGTLTPYTDYIATGRPIINSGTLMAYGNVSFPTVGSGFGGFQGSALIQVAGNAAGQTITGSANTRISNLTIAAGSNNVTLSNSLIFTNNYIVSSVGSLTTTGTTVGFDGNSGSATLTPGTAAYNDVSFFSHYGNTWNLGGGTMTINGNLTSYTDYTVNSRPILNSGTLVVYGNVSFPTVSPGYGGFAGSAVLQIAGNAGGQTITGSANTRISNLTIAAGSNNVTLSDSLIFNGNYDVSSVGTLTTTGSTVGFWSSGSAISVNPGAWNYNHSSFGAEYGGAINVSGTLNLGGNLTLSSIGSACSVNTGTIKVAGSVTSTSYGCIGSALLQFVGSTNQTLTVSGGSSLPSGNVTVNTTAGANLVLASAASWNNTGQTLTVTAGGVNMSGYALTVKGLSLNSTTVTKGGGTLTVNGTTVGTGSLYGGTVAP